MKPCSIQDCFEKRSSGSYCLEHHRKKMQKWRAKNPDRAKEIRRRSRLAIYKKNWKQRWRDYCNNIVNLKIKQEKLKRKPCKKCGEYAQAHHNSYMPEDILKVTWLCQMHHQEWHRKNTYRFPTERQVKDFKTKKPASTEDTGSGQ